MKESTFMPRTCVFTDLASFDQSLITPPQFHTVYKYENSDMCVPSTVLVKMLNSLELGTVVQQKDQKKNSLGY